MRKTADKTALEQPRVHWLHATQSVVVHHYAGQPTIFGQRVRLRPDGLSGEDATNRGELGVTVQQLDVACQLLHGVQTGYPLHLDRPVSDWSMRLCTNRAPPPLATVATHQ